jgi:sigma-B regulation protein RsbU (phosphoserine phosphatase)
VQLGDEDVLVLYSDGVTDAENPAGENFGFERLVCASQNCVGGTAQGLRDSLMDGLGEFVGGAPRFDDITLMTLVHRV